MHRYEETAVEYLQRWGDSCCVCEIVIHNTLIPNGDFLYQRYNVF